MEGRGSKGKEGEGYSELMEGRGRKRRGIKNKWREGEGRGGVFRINGGKGNSVIKCF